jgi:Flp pilus assembly protein TadD
VEPEKRGLLKGLALGVAMSSALLFLVDRGDNPPTAPVATPSTSATATPASRESLTEFLDNYAHPTSPHGEVLDPVEGDLAALLDAGEWMQAYQLAERQLQTDPENVEALLALVAVRLKMGQPTLASTLIEQALALAPNHAQALAFQAQLASESLPW